MSVEFDSPANRIISQFAPKNQFTLQTNLPDITFLRHLSILGRLRNFNGSDTTSSPSGLTLITVTPTVGETLFIYSATLGQTGAALGLSINWDDTQRLGISLSQNTVTIPYTDSFVGDSVKKLTVTWDASVAGTKSVTLLGWVENTSRIRDITA